MEPGRCAASSCRTPARATPPLLLLVTTLILLVNPAQGIRCVQCISESTSACVDSPPAPRPCDETAKYCIVVRESLQHNASVVTVTRTCSPVDLGSKCHESFSLAGESVLVCHEACGKDGCNGTPHRPQSPRAAGGSAAGSTSSGHLLLGSSSVVLTLVAAAVMLQHLLVRYTIH